MKFNMMKVNENKKKVIQRVLREVNQFYQLYRTLKEIAFSHSPCVVLLFNY